VRRPGRRGGIASRHGALTESLPERVSAGSLVLAGTLNRRIRSSFGRRRGRRPYADHELVRSAGKQGAAAAPGRSVRGLLAPITLMIARSPGSSADVTRVLSVLVVAALSFILATPIAIIGRINRAPAGRSSRTGPRSATGRVRVTVFTNGTSPSDVPRWQASTLDGTSADRLVQRRQSVQGRHLLAQSVVTAALMHHIPSAGDPGVSGRGVRGASARRSPSGCDLSEVVAPKEPVPGRQNSYSTGACRSGTTR
jgi:hypothetical protein